jgi:hypothetical protein
MPGESFVALQVVKLKLRDAGLDEHFFLSLFDFLAVALLDLFRRVFAGQRTYFRLVLVGDAI